MSATSIITGGKNLYYEWMSPSFFLSFIIDSGGRGRGRGIKERKRDKGEEEGETERGRGRGCGNGIKERRARKKDRTVGRGIVEGERDK